ncbi:MAG TPA: DUF5985 family protein [Gammaproteobacteria bacterium]
MGVFRFVLFLLAAVTSVVCMWLLLRAYARTRIRLLFWAGLCFIFLSVNNLMLFVDLIVLPVTVDLRVLRLGSALAGIGCLLYAFIWEVE